MVIVSAMPSLPLGNFCHMPRDSFSLALSMSYASFFLQVSVHPSCQFRLGMNWIQSKQWSSFVVGLGGSFWNWTTQVGHGEIPVILAVGGNRQEDQSFKASLPELHKILSLRGERKRERILPNFRNGLSITWYFTHDSKHYFYFFLKS